MTPAVGRRRQGDGCDDPFAAAVAVKPHRQRAVRADSIEKPGMIAIEIIQHIADAPLVIADLTGRNPNVYYELAICHMVKKPLVQIVQDRELLPVDIRQSWTICYNPTDWDGAEIARTHPVNQIEAVLNDPSQVDNPISQSSELAALRERGGADGKIIAETYLLRSDLSMLFRRLTVPSFETFIRDRVKSRNRTFEFFAPDIVPAYLTSFTESIGNRTDDQPHPSDDDAPSPADDGTGTSGANE